MGLNTERGTMAGRVLHIFQIWPTMVTDTLEIQAHISTMLKDHVVTRREDSAVL